MCKFKLKFNIKKLCQEIQVISESLSSYLNGRACHHLSGTSGEDPGLSDHLQHAGLPSTLIPNNHHLDVKRRRIHPRQIIKDRDEHHMMQVVQEMLYYFKIATKN